MNKLMKKITATALAGTMLFSLTGCEYRVNEIEENEKVSCKDEEGNELCVIALSKNNKLNTYELYGYLSNNDGKIMFNDVLNKRIYDFSNDNFKDYEIYYTPVYNLLYNDSQRLDYDINGGLSIKLLEKFDANYYASSSSEGNVGLGLPPLTAMNKQKLQKYYIDEDNANTKEEQSTLVKSNN